MEGLMSSQDADLFSDDEGPALEINKAFTKTDLPDSDSDPEIFRKAKRKVQSRMPRKKEMADDAKSFPSSLSRPSAAPTLPKIEGPCPVLWCGSKHDKSVVLSNNQWITLGKEGCTVRLPDKAVSSRHCQFRWSSQLRQVEFVDTSTNGTWVSGEKVHKNRNEPKILEHGANIVVEAESSKNYFSFMLDLRNTGLALGDPRELPRGVDRRKQELERDKWKKHLLDLRTRREKQESDILQKEKLFYELQAQRKSIDSKSQMWKSEIERLKTDTEAILEEMLTKRKQWKAKLQELYKEHEAAAEPLIEKTSHKQEQVNQLDAEVNHLEREIYPDRFAVPELPDEENHVKGAMEETDQEEEEASQPRPQKKEEIQDAEPKSAQNQSSGYAPTTPAQTPLPDSGAYQPNSGTYQHDSATGIDSANFADQVLEMVGDTNQAAGSAEAEPTSESGEPASKRARVEE